MQLRHEQPRAAPRLLPSSWRCARPGSCPPRSPAFVSARCRHLERLFARTYLLKFDLPGRIGQSGVTKLLMLPSTAHELTQMLRQVVTRGTATAANLTRLGIAGKTGTAQISGASSRETTVSFIAFAPADHPTIAVAVLINDPHGGFGGTQAAPIAAHVIHALLSVAADGVRHRDLTEPPRSHERRRAYGSRRSAG